MKGNTSSAVREQCAPGVVEKDTPEQALFRKLNFFPTPPWAARAIAYRLKEYDPGAMTVCDPACGLGHFAEPLAEVFGWDRTFASDIYGYGFGDVADFLACPPPHVVDWYVTNPPFDKAQEFVEQGLRLAQRGVIVLCRVAFLETIDRYALLYGGAHPMTAMWPFAERVPMVLGRWDPDADTATAYAAFAFHKYGPRVPPEGFAPGTREKYSMPRDAERFAQPAPIPLFDNMAPSPLFQGDNHE